MAPETPRTVPGTLCKLIEVTIFGIFRAFGECLFYLKLNQVLQYFFKKVTNASFLFKRQGWGGENE